MHIIPYAALSALVLAAATFTVDESLNVCHASPPFCSRSSIFEDELESDAASSSISLLQRAATLTKKTRLDFNSTDGLEWNRSIYPKKPILIKKPGVPIDVKPTVKPKVAHRARDPGQTVIVAPAEYRLRLAFNCLLGVIAVVAFFATAGQSPSEYKAKAHLSKYDKKAEALDSEVFFGVEQQVLQDFIVDSTDTYLLSVDERKRSLTYKALRDFITSEQCDVSRFGVAGNDRLAVMLGNRPEMIVAFWAFSRQCCFAPVNRKGFSRETVFTLHDLPAKAVVVRPEDKAHFLEAIIEVPIIECILDSETTGLFYLKGIECPVEPQLATRESVAVVLQTAGTTRKPKLVPLTHQNLILTGKTLAEMLDLTPEDRALNLVPLHHISGISNSMIAPVLSHSSVVCAPTFDGGTAFDLCLDYQPSWYFGSPTIHILMMHGKDPPRTKTVRLIRNATAALLPSTADDMTKFWGCEILPGYGMTECSPIAGHQCGRLVRIASVGPAAAPKISIDEKGEILIKGHSVFSGYEWRDHMEEDPNIDAFEPNEAHEAQVGSFHTSDGANEAQQQHECWFRTGDCGWIDELGYFSITGRFKELIIRGGENISPLEIEDHVYDARIIEKAVFSVTHEELGEVAGLAVKTKVPAKYLVELLRSVWKNSNLDRLKLPEVIVSVDELPKGLAGKPKRIALQKRLGLPSRSIHRVEPVAYTYSVQTGLVPIDFADEYKMGAMNALDSLGLTKVRDGVGSEIRNAVLSMYAASAFFVVCMRGQRFLIFPKENSALGITFIRMLGGDFPGGMHWNMQCFMACASFLLCQEPFSIARASILLACYFFYQWPFSSLVKFMAYTVSQEPRSKEVYYVDSNKRWFLLVMMFAYSSFSVARTLPYHGLQCILLALITSAVVIWPVGEYALAETAPGWLNYMFTLEFVDGLHCWFGLLMVYYVVGYYGHKALILIRKHPLLAEPLWQRRLKIFCPILFFGCLFLIFSSPTAHLAFSVSIDNGRWSSWLWDPFTMLLDQGSAIVMIILLSQTVRSLGPWLAPIGSCALGIYLGGDIALFCPFSKNDLKGASFGIIMNKVAVLPPLQEMITYLGFWPLQFAVVFLYSVFQMFVFGMPLHWVYLKLLSILNAQAKYWSSS